jgi:DNA repair protein RadC
MNAVFETRYAKVGETTEHYRSYKINSTGDALQFADAVLRPYFEDKRNQEEFVLVTLDTKYRPIRIVRITRGTLDASLVHPREVFRPAILDAAAAVLLVHNHPSGDPTPSKEDIAVTDRLTEAGNIIGVRVLDHLVIGESCLSISEYRF